MPCRPAICSHSLGRAWVHSLPQKLDAAARYSLDVELFYEDLYCIAKDLPGGPTPPNHLSAAKIVRGLCDERRIEIICLQPFMHYEGLRDRRKHSQRVEEMKLWIQMAKILRSSTIAIPSTFLSKDEASDDVELIVADLREIASLGAQECIMFAYEALAWGTYCDTWEAAWEVVTKVNRPNFGICLDTFNLAGRVFADPTADSRKCPNADARLEASLRRLVRTVDISKIVYVQVADAEYLAEPLREGHALHNVQEPARMSWSRNCRLFYGEEDRSAYLPVTAILKAILVDLGFQGCISAEIFNRSLTDVGSSVPAAHAERAAASWQRIVADLGLARSPALQSEIRTSENAPRAQL